MHGGITKTSARARNRSPLAGRGIIALLLGSGAYVSDERIKAERVGSLARDRRTADKVELIGAGHDLAADRSFQRLPEDPVLAERRQGGRDRDRLSVRANSGRRCDPSLTVTRHQALGKAAPVIEDPHPELLPLSVPADALGAAQSDAPLNLDVELPEQKVALIRSLAVGLDDSVVALIDPLAEHPFQLP